MTRFEYIEALKQALAGLPPELINKTVADYEKRIYDASAAGQSEDEIMAGLEQPQVVADKLRAGHASPLPAVVPAAQQRAAPAPAGPANPARIFFSFIGLSIFNLFLFIPGMAYAALLFAGFVVSIAMYGGGILITAGSMAGINQIAWDESHHPFHSVKHISHDAAAVIDASDGQDHTVVRIGEKGIHVETDAKPQVVVMGKPTVPAIPAPPTTPAAPAAPAAPGAPTAAGADNHDHTVVDIGPGGISVVNSDKHDENGDDETQDIDLPGLHIHNNDADDAPTISLGPDWFDSSPHTRIGIGVALTVAGIIAFLLCLVIARYTLLGLYRLAQMEFALLRGA